MLPPKGVYLPILKLHSILAVANLLAHNNISQICYCGQISLQVNCSFSNSLTFGGNIYFVLDGHAFEFITQDTKIMKNWMYSKSIQSSTIYFGCLIFLSKKIEIFLNIKFGLLFELFYVRTNTHFNLD